jgi:hypothetical protein
MKSIDPVFVPFQMHRRFQIVQPKAFRYLETPPIRIASRLSEARLQWELAGRLAPVEAQPLTRIG